MLRSNLALREDKSLVPGEYLHEVQKMTPYTQDELTPLQVREKLYYTPVAAVDGGAMIPYASVLLAKLAIFAECNSISDWMALDCLSA